MDALQNIKYERFPGQQIMSLVTTDKQEEITMISHLQDLEVLPVLSHKKRVLMSMDFSSLVIGHGVIVIVIVISHVVVTASSQGTFINYPRP